MIWLVSPGTAQNSQHLASAPDNAPSNVRHRIERELTLPDTYAVHGIEVETIARLHTERVIPGSNVSDHTIHPEHRGAMRIRCELGPERLIPDVLSVRLRPRKKDALIARCAVQDRRGLVT